MYAAIGTAVWLALSGFITFAPLIGPIRRWLLSQFNTGSDPWDYLGMFEEGVEDASQAIGLVLGWSVISVLGAALAMVVSFVWPVIVLFVVMGFIFYKLFKTKS